VTPAKLTLLIVGATTWDHPAIVEAVIRGYDAIHAPYFQVIVGNNKGADKYARDVCLTWRIPHHIFSGPDCNRAMLNDLQGSSWEKLVVVFHSALDQAGDTRDCVAEARRRGLAVYVVGAA
jgi:hypothetical protein